MSSPPDSPIVEVQGESLDTEGQFWLTTGQDLAKTSVGSLDDAAKQLISATTLAQTIYFAAISFSGAKASVFQLPAEQRLLAVIVLALPLFFWAAALLLAIRVFTPRAYTTNLQSPELVRDTYYSITSFKHRMLRLAQIILGLGFIPLVINVVLYMLVLPLPLPPATP
jgi:hypothetical protein